MICRKLVLIFLGVMLLCFGCGKKNVKPNILLITIDTLRRDHLGAYGYHRDTSPFIDSLAKKGVMFKHAITPVPQTAGSHASILSSLHPLTHNLVINGSKMPDNVQSIAEVLKANGYYTIGTVAVGILRSDKNFSQGFDSFSDRWEKEEHLDSKFPLPERTAKSVNESLFKQIDEYDSRHRDKPLFIWVHYFDPHGPYYDKKDITFKRKRREKDPRGVDLYDKEILYTDRHIRALHGYLETKGITGQLVTCITADHGEQLGEHGYKYGHADFYSENTYVPLIFHGFRVPENRVIDTYVSTMDIGVTLLGMAGLGFDYPTDGMDLVKIIEKPDAFQDRKFLVVGSLKYARSLQLLGYPYAFILNFDYHYKYWYLSFKNASAIAGENFKPLRPDDIKSKGKEIIFSVPHKFEKGRNYAVLRLDIPKNDGLALKVKVKPFLYTDRVKLIGQNRKISRLEVIYPVTVLDDIRFYFRPRGNTTFTNPRYAFMKGNQFPGDAAFDRKIENKLYKHLITPRKKKRKNEFYDLAADIEMEQNRLDTGKFKPTIIKYKKMIYDAFTYYSRKKDRLLRGMLEQKDLTPEDKKMLESLGYL
jgi:hypothetical protein